MGSSELRWASCLGPLEKFWKIMTWKISQVHILSYHVQIFINMCILWGSPLRTWDDSQFAIKHNRSSFSVPMWDKCNLFQQLLILSLPCSSWTYLTTNQPTFYGHCTGQPALITGGFCSCKVFLLSTRPPLLTHAVTEHVNGMEFLCSLTKWVLAVVALLATIVVTSTVHIITCVFTGRWHCD